MTIMHLDPKTGVRTYLDSRGNVIPAPPAAPPTRIVRDTTGDSMDVVAAALAALIIGAVVGCLARFFA